MKTPTPSITIESTFADPAYISGWIGTVTEDGTRIPEKDAYIYIYIDGFLVNPPSFDSMGNYNNLVKVISDFDGTWKATLPDTDLSLIYLKKGGVLTVRGKSKRKELSDLSYPYVIQGMATPINLGVTGDFGDLRPPKDGEFILMGNFSHWKPDLFLQCNNRVLIYSDGYYIGEVLPNNIVGTDAKFPLEQDLTGYTLDLLVNSKIVSIPFSDLTLQTEVPLTPSSGDGETYEFTFPIKNVNSIFKVYKNIRINNFFPNPATDYYISVHADNTATITFSVPPEPTDVITIFEVGSTDVFYNQYLNGILNGLNKEFWFDRDPNLNSIQLFLNGLHLKQGTDLNSQPTADYVVSYDLGLGRYIATFRVAPEAGDIILVDYQAASATTVVLSSPVLTQTDSLTFSMPLMLTTGNINVYKNGILQKQKSSSYPAGSYTITKTLNSVVLTFETGTLDTASGDVVTVTYEYIATYIGLLIDWLNRTPQFIDNCITALLDDKNAEIISLNNNYVTGDGSNKVYSIPKYDVDTTVRIFKNGIRQTEYKDFVRNDTKIEFTNYNKDTDIITSIIEYNTTDIVVQASYLVRPTSNNEINLSLTPYRDMISKDDSIQLYKNGLRLSPFTNENIEADFQVINNVIILANPITSTDSFVIDYQPTTSYTRYNYVRPVLTTPDGIKTDFEFETPDLPSGSWTMEVFVDGIKLHKEIDYTISDKTIKLKTSAPSYSSKLLVDFYVTQFNIASRDAQLKIQSSYPLELVLPPLSRASYETYRILFGSKYVLDPGKDTDGEFLYYIKGDIGEWKYSNLDVTTRKVIPFSKGEHLSARALNSTVIRG